MTLPLEGVQALLVEDEAIIAMTAEDMLQELCCTGAATRRPASRAPGSLIISGTRMVSRYRKMPCSSSP